MSRGVVIVANDTDTISYTKIASYSAARASSHLNLPVTLITDKKLTKKDSKSFEQVIVTENKLVQRRRAFNVPSDWKNFDRYRVYELSPYDETVVIDCDYIVNSDQLNSLWDLNRSFLCHGSSSDISKYDVTNSRYTGDFPKDMVWATVMMFRRDQFTDDLFFMWRKVQENFPYYAALYRFSEQLFRNDLALSVALHCVSGQLDYDDYLIKWPLLNFYQDVTVKLDKDNQDIFEFTYAKRVGSTDRLNRIRLHGHDFHMMNKENLLEISS